MSRKKRMAACLVCLLSIVCLTGCGGQNQSADEGNTNQEPETTAQINPVI